MGRHPLFVVIAGGTQTTGRGRNYIFCCCPHTSYLSVSAICHEKNEEHGKDRRGNKWTMSRVIIQLDKKIIQWA